MKGLLTVLLLVCSNAFMTLAWYGHIVFKSKLERYGLAAIILLSWGIALFEYSIMVPANRLGSAELGGPFTIWQLKVIQEVVSLVVFTLFVVLFMKGDSLKWNHLAGFACLVLATPPQCDDAPRGIRFIAICLRLPCGGSRRADQRRYPQQYDRTGYRAEYAAEGARGHHAEPRKHPTAQQTADDTHNEVDYQSRASALDDHVGNPSGYQTDQQIPKYKHNIKFLVSAFDHVGRYAENMLSCTLQKQYPAACRPRTTLGEAAAVGRRRGSADRKKNTF